MLCVVRRGARGRNTVFPELKRNVSVVTEKLFFRKDRILLKKNTLTILILCVIFNKKGVKIITRSNFSKHLLHVFEYRILRIMGVALRRVEGVFEK